MRAKIVLPTCPKSNINLTPLGRQFMFILCAWCVSRQNDDKYVHAVLFDMGKVNAGAFPRKSTKSLC